MWCTTPETRDLSVQAVSLLMFIFKKNNISSATLAEQISTASRGRATRTQESD